MEDNIGLLEMTGEVQTREKGRCDEEQKVICVDMG